MVNRKIRILLVDDESYYCHLVMMSLRQSSRSLDFIVHVSEDLVGALGHLKSYSYDLVLLDLGLPESNGLETFEIIHRAYPDMPVIILTHLDDEKTGIEAITKGASDYLVKGASPLTEVLVRSILYSLERKRGEERLRQSESNFRHLVNGNPDAVVVTSKKGLVLFANPAGEGLFGRRSEELRGKSLELPAAGDEPEEFEILRKGGGKAIVEMRRIETKWQGEDSYLISLRDITRYRSAENLLKKYRENLRALVRERTEETDAEKELLSVTFSSIGEGVVVVDPEKRILLFNEVAEELAGWEFELVQDKSIDKLFRVVDERTREVVESPIERVLRSGSIETGSSLEVLVSADGRERPIATVAAPIRIRGETIGVVMVFRDVSREREVERMKQDFVSAISHELRTPLTSIIAYTETILHDSGMPGATREQFLGIIEEQGKRLANLIEGLLEISRLESGTMRISREEVNISGIVQQVWLSLQPLADDKDIRLDVDIEEGLAEVTGDEGRIQSVVTNLVNNAIKFTPEKGEVSVSVRQEGEEVVIRVSDTGMGISSDALGKVFDPFYRVPASSERVQGTGLGLAIVDKIVQLHNGRIGVESEVNEGTTFTVFLPAARCMAEATRA
ncbi:MAG: PAS domain-containing sensor histidine kinase [Planctomycetota bacterium]|jgi:two-component system phosphate regulon sensor histidine kinase PhoR